MQLDLKKLPFGQYMSRHLLFEEADPMGRGWEKGLYLALAAGSNSMFGGFAMRSAGLKTCGCYDHDETGTYEQLAEAADIAIRSFNELLL